MNPTLKYLPSVLLLFIAQAGSAQNSNESFYAFKADWSPASSIEQCTYFMQEIKKSDSEYVCRYYQKMGPMIKQEVYKDAALSIPNGLFCWYNKKGKMDSCGWVANFKKDRYWYYFLGDSTKYTYYEKYDNGKLLKKETFQQAVSDTTGGHEVAVTQKEAVFKKGANDWTNYISKNLKVPDRFTSIVGRGKYTVTVCFTISTEGKTQDVYLFNSLEWSADAVIFDLIEQSPHWQPALQNGEPVKYVQKQNLVMVIN
jgi:hypothetical protein